MLRALALALLLALPLAGRARAQGAEAPIVASLVVGTLGGITTSIAAVVYAVDGRSFDSPWVPVSLVSSAICGAAAVYWLGEAAGAGSAPEGPLLGFLVYAGLSIWPAVWTIRGALSPVDPGDHLDGRDYRPAAVDPFTPDRRPGAGSQVFGLGFDL